MEADATTDALRRGNDDTAALRARLALDAGQMGSWAWNVQTGEVVGDPIVGEFFGMGDKKQPWDVDAIFANIHAEDLPYVREQVDHALAKEEDYITSFRCQRDGHVIWLGARGRVISRNDAGEPTMMLGVNWDITAAKEQEERLQMLASEMDHRVKNAFAVMRSLIRLAGRSATDVQSLSSTLEAQCRAMAEAHAISAKLGRGDGRKIDIPATEVFRTALGPWLQEDQDGRTVSLQVDDDVKLSPHVVSPVAMLIYELTTNATKHGPLGERGGRLDVTSSLEDNKAILIRWIETVKSDAVENAARDEAEHGSSGRFGSVLIQQCAATLDAKLKRELTPSGLHFELLIPPGAS